MVTHLVLPLESRLTGPVSQFSFLNWRKRASSIMTVMASSGMCQKISSASHMAGELQTMLFGLTRRPTQVGVSVNPETGKQKMLICFSMHHSLLTCHDPCCLVVFCTAEHRQHSALVNTSFLKIKLQNCALLFHLSIYLGSNIIL